MVLVGAAVGVALALVAVLIPWLPPADSAEALKIDDVYWFVTIICIAIFALVAGVSLYPSSGRSWIFRGVGALLFAGGDHGGSNGKGLTYASPIDAVLKALKASGALHAELIVQ